MFSVYFSIVLKNNFRSLTLNTFYLGLGIMLVYFALGLFAGTIGTWFMLNKEWFNRIIGGLLITAGVATVFGYTIGKLFPEQKSFTPVATIGYGALFGIAWSGCMGPVVGAILILASATGGALQGGFLLLIYALGMLTPLFILSFIGDRSKKAPRVWKVLRGKGYNFAIGGKTMYLHTTNILTGLLLILVGIFLFFNGAAWFSQLFPGMTEWVFSLQNKLQAIGGIA
jgi:cytochrome c-type biogenesis protein